MRHGVWAVLPTRLVWPSLCQRLGLEGIRVQSVRKTLLGREVRLRLRPPTTTQHLHNASEAIAVAFGAVRVRVSPVLERADRVVLKIDFETGVPPVRLVSETDSVGVPRSPLRPFPLGVDDDGCLVEASFLGRHILIGGNPGSGKSNAMRVFLAAFAASRNVSIYGIDPKRAELAMWSDRLTGLVLGNEAEPTVQLLSELLGEIQRRATLLAESGRSVLDISRETPWIVLVVDEWAELAAEGDTKQRTLAATLLRRYVSLGRAVGCSALLCTQRPTSDTVDTGTRALLTDRFALRCGDKYQAESILGLGTFEVADFRSALPGRALWSDGGPARAFQFFEVADESVSGLACAGYRFQS